MPKILITMEDVLGHIHLFIHLRNEPIIHSATLSLQTGQPFVFIIIHSSVLLTHRDVTFISRFQYKHPYTSLALLCCQSMSSSASTTGGRHSSNRSMRYTCSQFYYSSITFKRFFSGTYRFQIQHLRQQSNLIMYRVMFREK